MIWLIFLRIMSGLKFRFTDVVALLCNTFCRFNFVSLMAKDQVRVCSMPTIAMFLRLKLTRFGNLKISGQVRGSQTTLTRRGGHVVQKC